MQNTLDPPRVVTADRGDAGRRIDLVLRRHLTGVTSASRTRVQSWIEGGLVTVNGSVVRRASSRAAAGDVVAIALPAAAARRPMAHEEVAVRVLYEDEHLVIVDKPAGIVVHPTHKHPAGTLMNALLWPARAWPPGSRPSIVGRLDKLTSGLVVVAKTAAVHAAVQREWASPSTAKDYLALVYGGAGAARGEIALRLRRDPGDRRRVVASATEGAASLTMFERLGRVRLPRMALSLLRCRLVTGRTHQIRAHLAARGWPIVGDAVYGLPLWTQIADQALAAALRDFPRQALHAWRVELTHPVTGMRIRAEAPVPADLSALLTLARLDTATRTAAGRPRGPNRQTLNPRPKA